MSVQYVTPRIRFLCLSLQNPTLALQKGATKKTKGALIGDSRHLFSKLPKLTSVVCIVTYAGGRKRVQTGEVGRMTRSVRQHLDAPLELLNEMPMSRVRCVPSNSPFAVTSSSFATILSLSVCVQNNPLKQQPLAAAAVAVLAVTPLDASTNPAATAESSTVLPVKGEQTQVVVATVAAATASSILPGSQGSDLLLASAVQSDEQLEMALDDLPMLDSDEDLPFDSLLEDQVPPAVPVAGVVHAEEAGASTSELNATTATGVQQLGDAAATAEAAPELSPTSTAESAENTAESTAEGDDDDASNSSSASDDDDDNGSAVSGSPMPSPSPQTSPMMSRSPSP